jgi:probable O-glycosylation ligase (exosortase A-associated)
MLAVLGGNALRGPFEALLFYLWLAYFRPETWMWNPGLIAALNLSFSAGVYLLIRSLPSLNKAPFDLRAMLLLAFLLLTGLSAWMAPESTMAWSRWISFGKTLTVSYLLYVLASQDLVRFRTTVVVIALSQGFESIKQGFAGLLLNPGGVNMNRLPHLGDNNGVAVGMLLLATLFIALARTAPSKWERRLHLFFLVGVLARSITTYSRGAFLALGAFAVVYVLRSNQKMKALVGVVAISAIILPVLPSAFWDRMNTMNVTSEDQLDTSSVSRLHFWRVATLMAADHPLLGIGYDSFNVVYNEYDFSLGFYGQGRSVHSMWFGVLAEVGYPALLLFIAMFVLALTGMQRVAAWARRGELPLEFYHLAVSLQVAFVAAAVGGSFLPWQYVEMLWHFIALTMALRALALKSVQKAVAAPALSYQQRRTA